MTWGFVQSASSAATAAATTKAVTYTTANVSSGTKLIVLTSLFINGGNTTVTSVKDGAGNSMTLIGRETFTQGDVAMWAMDTPAGDVGTKPTITATLGLSAECSILVQEVSGLAVGNTLAAMIDGTLGAINGTGGASTGSPTYVSSAANEYMLAAYGDTGGPETWTKPAALTADPNGINSNSNDDVALAYGNSTNGTEVGSWALTGTSTTWGALLVAFKLAGAAPPNTSISPAQSGKTWRRHFKHHQTSQQPITYPFTVVQAAVPVTANSQTTATVTLPQATGSLGPSTLVALAASTTNASLNPNLSGITLGGSADNWASCEALVSSTVNNANIWYDPLCASGQTSVVFTFTSGTGTTPGLFVQVYEVLGSLTLDQGTSSFSSSAVTAWSSSATAALTQSPEIAFSVINASAGVPVVTGVGNWSSVSSTGTGGSTSYGYQNGIPGTTATYSGTQPSGTYGAVIATFYAGLSAAPTPAALHATSFFPAPSLTATTAVQNQPAYNRWRLPIIGQVLGIWHQGRITAAVTPSALGATAHFPAPNITATTAVAHQPAYNRNRLPIAGQALGVQHKGHYTAPAGWTLVQESANQTLNGVNTLPAGSTSGNLLIATVTAGSGTTVTGPAGWSVVTSIANSTNSETYILAYFNNPGSLSSFTFTGPAGAIQVSVAEFTCSGVNSVAAASDSGTAIAGVGATVSVSTAGTASATDLVILAGCEHVTTAAPLTWTDPAGFTEMGTLSLTSVTNHGYDAYELSAVSSGVQSAIITASLSTSSSTGWTGAMATFSIPAAGSANPQPIALVATAHFPTPNITATTAGINQPAYNRWRLPPRGYVLGIQHHGYVTATVTPSALAATGHFPAPVVTATTAVTKPTYNRGQLPIIGRIIGVQHHGSVTATAAASALHATTTFPGVVITATTHGINQPAANRNRLPTRGQVIGIQHQGTVGQSTRWVGFVAQQINFNQNGFIGEPLTTASGGGNPYVDFPGGGSPQTQQTLPCRLETFTDYLQTFPMPPVVGFMQPPWVAGPAETGFPNNVAALYFGTGAGLPATYSGYPGNELALTNPAALTSLPVPAGTWTAPRMPNGSPAVPAIPLIAWHLGFTSLIDIANGLYDANTIIPAAQACKNWPADPVGNPGWPGEPGGTVMIRLMHEFNGTWAAYCPGDLSQPSTATAATFVAVWQHIVEVFAQQGATNVRWIWCPNVCASGAANGTQAGWTVTSGTTALCYPGDNYVDYIGIDGYNKYVPNWTTFANLFQPTYNWITAGDAFTIIPGNSSPGPICNSKPIIICETSSMEDPSFTAPPQTKAQYINDISTVIPASMPLIQGVMIWHEDVAGDSLDWFADSSPASASAWNSLAHYWTGRPPAIEGITSQIALNKPLMQPAYNRNRLPVAGRVMGIRHQGSIPLISPTPNAIATRAFFPGPVITATTAVTHQPAYNRWRLPQVGRTTGIQHLGTFSQTATPSALAATAHFPGPVITATTAVTHQPAYNRWRLPVIGRMLGIWHQGRLYGLTTPAALAATAHFPAPTITATTAVTHQPAYNRWRLPIIGRMLGIQHHGYLAAQVAASALAATAHFPAPTIKATTAVTHQPAYNRWRLPLIGRVLGIQHHGSISLTSTVTPAVLACSTVIPAVAPGVVVPGLVPVLALAAHFPAPLVIANDILSVSALAASTTLPTPTVDNNVVLGPPALAARVTLPMPTVNAGEVALAVALGATTYFPVPAISTSSVSTATALGATAHLPAPSVPVGPVTTHGASSLPAPFVTTNSIVTAVPIHGTVTITGTPSMPTISLAATAHFGVPVINEGTAPAATALGATSYFPVPTVITTTVWASTLHAATTLPAPSGAVTVPAVAEAGTTTFPAPTVNEGQGAVPAALGALSHFPAPAIAVTVPAAVLAATAHLPAPAIAAGEVPAPAAIAAAAHLPTPVVLVSASPGALHGAVTFPLPAVRADMKLSPPVLAATTKFPAALLIAHWTVTATAEFAFNVGQGEPDMTRTAGDAPWISSIDASSALSETPWISSEDGTIRMAETPTIWIQGDGS